MKHFFSLFLIGLVLLSACSDNSEAPAPTVTIASAVETVADGDSVGQGALMKFRLVVDGHGAYISNIVATITDRDQMKTMMDVGVWATSLDTIVSFYKGAWDTENWTFSVMNNERLFGKASLTIYRDPVSAYGAITTWPDVTLTFQNTDGPHFFDVETGDVLTLQEAATRPADVDFAVYYYMDGTKPSPTFSSPGDEDAPTYYPAMNGWSALSYTKWDYVSQTTADAFDRATNDSLLIDRYDDVWGRRKYKFAYAGWVFPFKTTNGKIGLVKVIRSDNDAAGSIQFAVKVQQ